MTDFFPIFSLGNPKSLADYGKDGYLISYGIWPTGLSAMDVANSNIRDLQLRRIEDLAHEPPFSVGELEVNPADRSISRGDQRVVLEPKAMKVLVALSDEPGEVLSPDDLIEMCWEGRIVGDSTITRVLSLLRADLRKTSGESVQIENVRSVGYRLVCQDIVSAAEAPSPRTKWAAIALTLVAIVTFALAWQLSGIGGSTSTRTILILSETAQDSDERFVAEGISQQIARDLQSSSGLETRSSISAAILDDQGASIEEIGNRLGAQLVLATALRREGDQLRLSYKLHDLDQETVILSNERMATGEFVDLLPRQAATDVFSALGLSTPTANLAKMPRQLDAEVYFVASALLKSRDGEQIDRAAQILRSITRNNPDFAEGWSLLAKALRLKHAESLQERVALTDEARTLAERALRMAPQSPEVLKVYGLVADEPEARLDALEKATKMAPLDAEAWLWLSNARLNVEASQGDLEAITRVIELEPLWPRSWQAAHVAAAYGNSDLADRLDELVISAAENAWQGEFARARIAMRRGELAESLRLARRAMKGADITSQWQMSHDLKLVPLLLGVAPFHDIRSESSSPLARIVSGELPSENELRSSGLTPESIWQLGPPLEPLVSLLVRYDRPEFLVEAYDQRFGRPELFASDIRSRPNGDWWLAHTSAYLAWALLAVERKSEAEEILAFGLEAANKKSFRLDQVVATSAVYAMSGKTDEATLQMMRAMEMGWPYAFDGPSPAFTGPLVNDPVFAPVQADPRFALELASIRSQIANERRKLNQI